MPTTPPNVKIYDRPEPKKPSPIMIGLLILAILIIGYLAYHFLHHVSAHGTVATVQSLFACIHDANGAVCPSKFLTTQIKLAV